jgi:hypothetical protein
LCLDQSDRQPSRRGVERDARADDATSDDEDIELAPAKGAKVRLPVLGREIPAGGHHDVDCTSVLVRSTEVTNSAQMNAPV